MRLHVLGNGCPAPSAEWYGSAFILEVGADSVMVDCGPATTYKMARMGIPPGQVERLFFTHHHFDHNSDFACFALTRWDQSKGVEPALKVYGPPPTRTFVDRLLGKEGAFFDDWHSRVTHPASHECHRQRGGVFPRPAPAIEAEDVGPGRVAESDTWVATAARVHHVEPTLESLVYRFDADQGSVLFTGDCADCKELRQIAQGVDTLVIACPLVGRSNANSALADVITGTSGVAAIASECGAKRVVLTHVTPGFSKPGRKETAIAEVSRDYHGRVLLPNELTTVELTA